MPTRNINRTDHFDDFVERQVSFGRYSNASEFVREAPRLGSSTASRSKVS